jgi:riboflavin kinase / FMN adenylyltransferase
MSGSGGGLVLPVAGDGTVVTVGTFDGVHRGHWHVLEELRETAARQGRPSVLVTFDPHPLAIVRPDRAPAMLSTPAEKIEVLAESGVSYVVFVRFDARLADYAPERFVDEILIRRYGMAHLVIGYDHGFGKGRSGDVDTLRRIGAERGFGVDVVEAVASDSEPVSSSRIRHALEAGDVSAAAEGLGRPYLMRATVVRGDGRGRTLGYPTANLVPGDPTKLVPRDGIYAARALVGGSRFDGVLHIGPRPTFPGASRTIELHLFDFSENLYGEEIGVTFHERIRDIVRFDTAEALMEAIDADCAAARRILGRTSRSSQAD